MAFVDRPPNSAPVGAHESSDPSTPGDSPGANAAKSSAATERPSPSRPVPGDALPPVEPPSAGFLIQLFLAPALIVGVIVVVWLLVDWLAHMEADPKQYVDSLRRDSKDAFQKAYNLADMLRSDRAGELKNNAELATQLAAVLNERLDADKSDEESVKLRLYLTKALGEFNTPAGAPTLLRAMAQDKTEQDDIIRKAAIESLAALMFNVRATSGELGPLGHPDVSDALLAASNDKEPEIRLRAAMALGILGSPKATERLKQMLDDPSGDVDINAATGLARQGDPAGLAVLVKMLSPDETEFIQNDPADQQEDKRLHIMLNGLRGIETLVDAAAKQGHAPAEKPDFGPASKAVERLKDSRFPLALRDEALRTADKLAKTQ